ncbi:MAG: glycerophosphodiester phosphodiesterase family protein [Methanothermobacter sp.]|nr:glycerophosphodiester phosphodiesterase family protein [Methanothermobacter sp.]
MVEFIAHRGASYFEPENTLRAVRRAVEMGADRIEVDVRLSQDNELIVIHDPTVDRTTNGTGRVDNMTFQELRSLNAGKGEHIPTLQEIIESVRDVKLVIEMKIPGIEEMVLKTIHKNRLENVLITSFYHRSLQKVKILNDNIKTGVIFSCQPLRPEILALDADSDAIFPKGKFVDPEMIKRVHEHDILIYPWTIDNPKKAEKLIRMGVDGIVTNKLIGPYQPKVERAPTFTKTSKKRTL